jgi:murein DD-endopeptidase MepM/ murein hydrolase activator NlpD
MGMGSDDTVTGSTGYRGTANLNQPMPAQLDPTMKVAQGPFIPPEDIGGGPSPSPYGTPDGGQLFPPVARAASPSVSSQDLPVIGQPSSPGNSTAMSAQPAYQPHSSPSLPPMPPSSRSVASLPAMPVAPPAHPAGTYTHTIRSGESLYTIARHYGVTAQAIMDASDISAPDKIYVGQRVIIPGRPDLLAAMDHAAPPAPGTPKLPVDSARPVVATNDADAEPIVVPPRPERPAARLASLGGDDNVPLAGRVLKTAPPRSLATPVAPTPMPEPAPQEAAAPATPAPAAASPAPRTAASTAPARATKLPLQEPAVSGADKFRWPVTGKILVNFAASNDTGINIAAPIGAPVKATENGTVIYVGNGVEGYGNLILIRHGNGYVSAYANLKDTSVAKGTVVARGDTIGTVGETGSVSSPQLHFELRKGATPVNPVPLLAG